MTTTTQEPIKLIDEGAELLAAHPVSIDFATRLEMAAIGIGVRLEVTGGADLEAARAAARVAVADAESAYVPVPVRRFEPHPVLKAAGDMIRANGWIQNDWTGNQGEMCLWAAVARAADATHNHGRFDEAEAELRDRITAMDGKRPGSLPQWNDAEGRTVEQVLSILY